LERGTRMVFESGRPVAHVTRDLGIHHETLRKWVRQTEADEGRRSGSSGGDVGAGNVAPPLAQSEAESTLIAAYRPHFGN